MAKHKHFPFPKVLPALCWKPLAFMAQGPSSLHSSQGFTALSHIPVPFPKLRNLKLFHKVVALHLSGLLCIFFLFL